MSASWPPPNRGESLIHSATKLSTSKSNDLAPRTESQSQNWISNLLDIQSGHCDVERATANESRRGCCCKIRKWEEAGYSWGPYRLHINRMSFANWNLQLNRTFVRQNTHIPVVLFLNVEVSRVCGRRHQRVCVWLWLVVVWGFICSPQKLFSHYSSSGKAQLYRWSFAKDQQHDQVSV